MKHTIKDGVILIRLANIGAKLEEIEPTGGHHAKVLEIFNAKGWPGVDVYSLEILHEKGLLKGVDIKAELERVNNIYTKKEKKYLEGLGS